MACSDCRKVRRDRFASDYDPDFPLDSGFLSSSLPSRRRGNHPRKTSSSCSGAGQPTVFGEGEGRGREVIDLEAAMMMYPSPPSSESPSKRKVPLPPVKQNQSDCDSQTVAPTHRQSPLSMPLSPPPTSRVAPASLPPPDLDDDTSLFYSLSPLFDGDEHRPHDEDEEELLSPLSPEWGEDDIPSPNSVMLHTPLQEDTLFLDEAFSETRHSSSSSSFEGIPPSAFVYGSDGDIPILSRLDTGFYLPPPWATSQPSAYPHVDSPELSPVSKLQDLCTPFFSTHRMQDDFRAYPHPQSPLTYSPESLTDDLFHEDLGDDDDDEPPESPCSPSSLRSFHALPEMEDSEVDFLPFSPSSSVLSLPGASTDDDLFDSDLATSNFIPEPSAITTSSPFSDFLLPPPPTPRSLLLDETEMELNMPRSPSPENFDELDPAVFASCGGDESTLQQLLELKRRTQQAVATAKAKEEMMDPKSVARAELKRFRKEKKERGREISALLRLKLGERRVPLSPPSSSDVEKKVKGATLQRVQPMPDDVIPKPKTPKTMITSMAQLVARMMFRRNEGGRPVSGLPASSKALVYGRSPLASSFRTLDMEEEKEKRGECMNTEDDSHDLSSSLS